MLNVIRTTPSRIKYCGRTIDNLIESNGSVYHPTLVISSGKTPNDNGILALKEGIRLSEGKPFVFLEDDLTFIKNFNTAAADFARDCEGLDSPILPLCAAYPDALVACRGLAWRYPEKSYYGSQAFVIDPEKAAQLVWFAGKENPVAVRGFDLLIRRWAQSLKATHFLTPYRCFVQHLGVESSLHNGRFHHYSMWPGPDWTYRSGAFSLKEQVKRPCDKPLAKAIADWFGKETPVFDLGCSTGNYLTELQRHGLTGKGFDATPGIARDHPKIEEVDLSREQAFRDKPGNVMCLEVAEHIHPENESAFLGNIKTLCSNKLVLSWAVPGQGGRRHVNEKPWESVSTALRGIGFERNGEISTKLREAATIKWFKDSLYAFQRA